VPQFGQNRASAATGVRQAGQGRETGVPQFWQKVADSATGEPHDVHARMEGLWAVGHPAARRRISARRAA
jgi:hypothetical protein